MIENERKYVLDVTGIASYKKYLMEHAGATSRSITQHYLDVRTRIRQSVFASGETTCMFTYKINTPHGLEEIETEIDLESYERLASASTGCITKTRVAIPFGDLMWEVDFFIHDTFPQPFLVMAEVELPRGVVAPMEIPNFVYNYLLHTVDCDDRRFDNVNLVEPSKIVKIVDALKNG